MRPFEPTRAGLGWLAAVDARTGRRDTITVARNRAGRLAPRRARRGTRVGSARGGPAPGVPAPGARVDTLAWVVEHARWSYEGGRWVRRATVRAGYFETGDEFSAAREFP
jgi:hypothetical protein